MMILIAFYENASAREPMSLPQVMDGLHLGFAQCEIEDIQVFAQALRVAAAGNGTHIWLL